MSLQKVSPVFQIAMGFAVYPSGWVGAVKYIAVSGGKILTMSVKSEVVS
jgi:hypothetical protein